MCKPLTHKVLQVSKIQALVPQCQTLYVTGFYPRRTLDLSDRYQKWFSGGREREFGQQSSEQLLEKFLPASSVKDACVGPGSAVAAQWHDVASASGTQSTSYS